MLRVTFAFLLVMTERPFFSVNNFLAISEKNAHAHNYCFQNKSNAGSQSITLSLTVDDAILFESLIHF